MDEETKEKLIKASMKLAHKLRFPVQEWYARQVLEYLIEEGCFNG